MTPHVFILVVCLLVFAATTNYLLVLRRRYADDYDYDDNKPGKFTDKPGDPDGDLDSVYRRASKDQKFLTDQHTTAGEQQQQPQKQTQPEEHQFTSGRYGSETQAHVQEQRDLGKAASRQAVLVSYSYTEHSIVHKANFEFFIIMAMGIDSRFTKPAATEFVVVVNGQTCEPCSALLPDIDPVDAPPSETLYDQVKQSDFLTLIFRWDALGHSTAAHNVTLEWAARAGRLQQYAYVIFVTSSARGPFVPSYMPAGWQWTDAFARFFVGDVHAVGASLACRPAAAPGGPGPHLEGWAFALDRVGVDVLVTAGVFAVRPCAPYCDEAELELAESAISKVLLSQGHNIATLLSKYGPNVDWRDHKHYACNDNVYPSRHGSYEAIDMHPFETLFVQSAWHVGEPFTAKYSRWFMFRALGRQTTRGHFDEAKYSHFLSEEAQLGSNMSLCYPRLTSWRQQARAAGNR